MGIARKRMLPCNRADTLRPVKLLIVIGRHHLAEKQHLSRSAVSSTQNQARCPVCDQGHGRQTSPLDLSHAALRHEIRGPRSSLIRASTPRVTDQAPQVQSRKARIPSHPNTGGGLTTAVSGEAVNSMYSCEFGSRSARQADCITLILSPEELDAMIDSGGVAASISAKSFTLKSWRSGPFSWTRSASATAFFKSVVNFR